LFFKFLCDTATEEDLQTYVTLEQMMEYSDYSVSLKLLHERKVEAAFLNLVKFPLNLRDYRTSVGRVLSFAGQRVFYERGFESFKEGNLRSKKYLSEALDLMKAFPKLQEHLVEVIYQNSNSPLMSAYSNVMKDLCRMLPSHAFKQAAAYAISIQARNLFYAGTLKPDTANRLIDQALQIDPKNATTLTFQEEIGEMQALEQAIKALSRTQYEKAYDIMSSVKSVFILDQFFEAIRNMENQLNSYSIAGNQPKDGPKDWKDTQRTHLSTLYVRLKEEKELTG
jgi:hypothetical protein